MQRTHKRLQTTGCVAGLLTILVTVQAGTADEAPNFLRDIRPILAKACFHCHGPDQETREADLRLDTREGLFGRSDERSIVVPGKSQQSELVKRISTADPELQMPPANSGKSLTTQQREMLIRWIDAGAVRENHWAFVPPALPVVPVVQDAEMQAWSRNAIDAFLLHRQRSVGLAPSPHADPDTLIRRVFLDLLGLPPTIPEADAWRSRLLAVSSAGSGRDSQPVSGFDAVWADLVDHLLARPEYGERWARRWLDLARYADTNGYEKDRPRSIWPWRDWVIQALNRDMPFDQFSIEQLAGDLLPEATLTQRIATGFHRNTMLNEEGGIDPLEFRFHAMTDRVATTGTTWLGLTLGCVQCHSHKYDPIQHREYYQLMAFLNNADEPSLSVPDANSLAAASSRQQEAQTLLAELPRQWPITDFEAVPSERPVVSGTGGEKFSVDKTGKISVSGSLPETTTYLVDFTVDPSEAVSAIEFQAFTAGKAKGPGRAENGNFVLSEFSVSLVKHDDSAGASDQDDAEIRIPIQSITASAEQAGYSALQCIDGDPATGWAVDQGDAVARNPRAVFRLDTAALSAARAAVPDQPKVRLRARLVQNHGSSHFVASFRLRAGRQPGAAATEGQRQTAVQAAYRSWLEEQRDHAVAWTILLPKSATSNLPLLTIQEDGSVFASGDTTKQDRYRVELQPATHPVTAIRLEALPDPRLPGNGPGTTYYEGRLGDFYLNELSIRAGERKLPVRSASESYAKNRFGNSPVSAALTLDGDVQTGWSVAEAEGQRHTAVYVLEKPVEAGTPLVIEMIFGRHFASSLGRFRFSGVESKTVPAATQGEEHLEALLLKPEAELTTAEQQSLYHAFLLSAPELAEPARRVKALLSTAPQTTSLVLQERPTENPRPTFRHHRGEYLQPKEAVVPQTPEFLHRWPGDLPKNRLGFARWLVHRENPLTARVVVNRQWAAFFGRGLVETQDDFGIQGSLPSHPELLDWLAVTLMDEDHWSMKSLHRRIVTSQAYRQSSLVRPESPQEQRRRTIDPENRLLTVSPRYRLDAEVVRDSVLQAAGVLSLRQGGPPVRPPQPAGITEVAFGSPAWDVSAGEDRYRRSIYTLIKRTAPFAMVSTFDGPSGESCVARRNRSNTPLQALTLLNDPMFIDLARQSGQRLAALKTATDDDRIREIFQATLTRLPDPEEMRELREFTVSTRSRFALFPATAGKLASDESLSETLKIEVAVWAAVSRAMFSLDEFVTRP